MIKLYTAENSICTQKVFLTLLEKGLDWESEYLDLFKNEQYRPEYVRINPKGVVPSLVYQGKVVIESSLICEFLNDTFPTPPLVPSDAYERARMRLWSKHIDEGVFEATREISFSAMFRDKMKSMTQEQRQGRFNNIGDPGRRARFMSTYEEGVESVYVAQGIFAFEKMFGEMDEALADGRDWLVGEFSLADINLIPFVARLNYLRLLNIWTSNRPLVRAWWKRARTRPSFHKAIENNLRPDQISAMESSGAGIRDRLAERYREIVTPAQRAA